MSTRSFAHTITHITLVMKLLNSNQEFLDKGIPSLKFGQLNKMVQRYITFYQLSFLIGENFNTRRIANCLGISVSTIQRRLLDNGISLDRSYSVFSDADLGQLIRTFHSNFPRIGCLQMRAMLDADYRLSIQRCRLRMAIRGVDPAGAAIRWSEVHVRRRYDVYGANALWHIDTCHSLIRWRLVVTGGIDGYSRLITYSQCFNNNPASTIVQCFYQGT